MFRKNKLPILVIVALLVSLVVQAQTPGGVPVAAWYRADAINSLFSNAGITPAVDHSYVQQWNESQGTGRNLLQNTAGSRPMFSNTTTLANFNPTVTFDGSNDWMQYTAPAGVNIIDRATGSIFAAGYMNKVKRSGFAGFHASMDYPGLHVYSSNNKLLFFTGGPGYQGLSMEPILANSFFSAGTGWMNGVGATPSRAAATVSLNGNRVEYAGSELNNANLSTGARDFRIGGDNNYGAFSGQLNEILVFEDRLSPAQMDQVETYMAIKYGTTYASGTRDYKNAAGNTIWSATANAAYRSNIAGISRDNNGALHQKQSWSTNTNNEVLIGMGLLANSNADNTTELNDGQSLIWGDNGLLKYPSVPFAGLSNVSHRFAAIWKVQNTGSVGVVRIAWPKTFLNLKLIRSVDNIISATDDIIDMSANETTINGVVYNYADVTFNTGEYFTLAANVPSPGGVSANLRIWLKPDDGFSPAEWIDKSGNGNNFKQAFANRQPIGKPASEEYNFNPFVDFGSATSADARFMSVPVGRPYSANGTNSSMFLISKLRGTPTYTDMLGFGATATTASLANADNPVFIKYGTKLRLYPYAATKLDVLTNKLYLNDVSFKVGTAGIKFGLNGKLETVNATVTAANAAHAKGAVLGSQPQVTNGTISEVIAYERDLDEAEKIRVRSYMAIKFGLTLPHDYIASNGTTTMWNIASNAGYNNSIAGIGRDDNSALLQKQSKSVESGSNVIVGLTPLANSNAENLGALGNEQFLMWGDNGLAKVPSVTIAGVTGINFRFASVWKVQNTGNVGTVRVAWPTGLTNLTLLQSTAADFTTVSNAQSMNTTIVINGRGYNYADVTLNDGEFFTFGAQLNGPGGVGQDLRVWLRSDAGFEPDSWTDFSGNSNHYTQTNVTRQPAIANQFYNFNPVVSFGGAGSDARFMVVPSGKPYSANGTSSTLFVASLSKGLSGYTDIIGFGGTTATATLWQANDPAFTKLNNHLVLYPHTTVPALPDVVLNRLYLDDVSFSVGLPGIKYGQNGALASVPATVTAAQALHANGSIIGSQAEVRNGSIGEVIAYQRDLTEPEKQRVRTYVAIKYGLTLPHDYMAANGTTKLWDIAANTGYNNNIAGIARDDQGSLYQKQSNSINAGTQVLISTTSLNSSNATNAGALNDQQFLTWGDNNLNKGASVAITGITDINYRFAALWKVQNVNSVGTVRVAWPKGFSNLKLIQSADETIDDTDAITEMSGTQSINGVEYAYADVTFTDGQYFTFGVKIQGPGGVTNNLSYWYRADKMIDTSGGSADVLKWTDFTSGATVEQLGENEVPKLKGGEAKYFNFNPGINFTSNQQTLGNLNVQTVSALSYDIFSLTKEGLTYGSNGRVFSSLIDNNNLAGSIWHWDAIGLMGDNRIERSNIARNDRYLANPGNISYSTTHPSIMYNTFTDVNVSKGLNGAPNGTAGTHSARGQMTGGHAFGSTVFLGNGSDNYGLIGNIGELIVFGKGNVTPAERNKVESYLAVKYGVTMHNGQNYTTSGDVVVWDKTANSSYYFNVAGIGNDVNSALHQKQSRSQHANTNDQVIIGLGEIAATNAENTYELTDGQFLMWGDNNYTLPMTTAAARYTSFVYAGSINNGRRMNRIWKVQNTNVTNELQIRFPVASVGTNTLTTGDACAKYAIIFAADEAFTTNVVAVPLNISEEDANLYEAMISFPNGTSYFSFGKVTPMISGVVYLPEDIQTTSDLISTCGAGEWSYFSVQGDGTRKLFASSGITPTELAAMQVTITPEGVVYDDDSRITQMMPRITTVKDDGKTYTGAKVRVYYDAAEMAATQVPGAQTNSWFKYSGDADSVLIDVYGDGLLDASLAVAITPDASGVEDGVNYVEFHNITSFSSFVYISSTVAINVILPVNLLDFKAKDQNNVVLLSWETATEQNNNGFQIEHSVDSRKWTRIAHVSSKGTNGSSSQKLLYAYVDANAVVGTNYYRLKQIDFDGKHIYSQVKHAVVKKTNVSVTLAPNPILNNLYIKGLEGTNSIIITNSHGQVMVKVLKTQNTEQIVDMSRFPTGVYFVRIEKEGGEVSSHKIIKK